MARAAAASRASVVYARQQYARHATGAASPPRLSLLGSGRWARRECTAEP